MQAAARSPRAPEVTVHLFVAADGPGGAADRDYLAGVWQACGSLLGMTEAIPGLGHPIDLPAGSWDPRRTEVLAARRRGGAGVRQAVLRREQDTWCLSLVLAPEPGEALAWADLDALCTAVLGTPTPGVLGAVRLYTAYRAAPSPAPRLPAHTELRRSVPADPTAPASWPEHGAPIEAGIAVWDVSAAGDDATERRLLITCPVGHAEEPNAVSWIGAGPDLPLSPIARYLLHSAKVRYQLRVWRTGREALLALRDAADAAVADLLAATRLVASARRAADIAAATATARTVDALQMRELGLIDGLTRLREMRRTVEIASTNMTGAGFGSDGTGGLFAEDHALTQWFLNQLDDDALYVDNALQRAERIGTLADQLVERGQRRRQESVNLGLTGVVGAIVMALSAIQAFQYTVDVPQAAKPALIALLGSFALLSSMIVANVVTSRRRWTVATSHVAVGVVGASLAWLLAVVAAGRHAGPDINALCAGAGMLAGLALSLRTPRRRRRRAPDRG
ncbi:CATRA conflict system CASPASE/TPR repeat-associated protein [Streptomyces mirabilis]